MIDFSKIYESTFPKRQIDIYKKIFIKCNYDINSTIDYLIKHKEYDFLDIAPNKDISNTEQESIIEYLQDVYFSIIEAIEAKDLLKDFDSADELYDKLMETDFEVAYTTSPILVTSTSAFKKVFIDSKLDFDINKRFLGLTAPYKEDGEIKVKCVISYLTYNLSEDKIVATIAHEVAHVLDYYINGSLSHGKSWNACADLIMSLFTKKKVVISETANNYFDDL